MDEKKQPTKKPTRRAALKTVAYVVPVVLTLTASPARARGGSGDWDSDSHSD